MAGLAFSDSGGLVARAHNIEDLRTMARRRLPKVIFDYLDGGADDEVTFRSNREAFMEYLLNSRMLVDVSAALLQNHNNPAEEALATTLFAKTV